MSVQSIGGPSSGRGKAVSVYWLRWPIWHVTVPRIVRLRPHSFAKLTTPWCAPDASTTVSTRSKMFTSHVRSGPSTHSRRSASGTVVAPSENPTSEM